MQEKGLDIGCTNFPHLSVLCGNTDSQGNVTEIPAVVNFGRDHRLTKQETLFRQS